jgi:glycosyltransferase involved in cell wall biosynthesis
MPDPAPQHRRLGVYFEIPFRHDDDGYSTHVPFIRFVLALRPHFDGLLLIGRVDPVSGREPYAVPEDVEVAPLPHYGSLKDTTGMLSTLPATLRAIWGVLGRVDAVWVIGPVPTSIPVVALGLARKKRLVLGVRRNLPLYVRHRLGGKRWTPTLGASHVLEVLYRLLARRIPTVAVGADLARLYSGGTAPVLEQTVSLVSEADLRSLPAGDHHPDAERPVELLSVGRLDPEKAPDMLLKALALLEERHPEGYRLTIVGDGQLEDQLRAEANRFGPAVRFRGHVPNGPELFDLYRASDLFVHVARTEGLPQVLTEAQAAGLPIVATDVGGVRAGLGGGTEALLVPPNDPEALAAAIMRLASDGDLRTVFRERGLARVRTLTLERQAARLAAFISAPEAREPGYATEHRQPGGD